jgi:hybrid cluster-associated redox disulfide protein
MMQSTRETMAGKKSTPKKAAPKKAAKSAPKKKTQTAPKQATNPAPSVAYITKDMTMGEILSRYPDAAYVMLSHGLHCIGCHISPYESLEMGSMGHGMDEDEFRKLLAELNALALQAETAKTKPT